jgi:hypothetical protein
MNFSKLSTKQKEQLHSEVIAFAMSIGGKNFFLQMKETLKKEKLHPLVNKSQAFNYPNGKLTWNKFIYKDTFGLLIEAVKREENSGNILENISPKEHKAVINMMKTLKPVEITVKPKNRKDGDGSIFKILDTHESEKTKTSIMFKVIFFYSIDLVKQILNYKKEV